MLQTYTSKYDSREEPANKSPHMPTSTKDAVNKEFHLRILWVGGDNETESSIAQMSALLDSCVKRTTCCSGSVDGETVVIGKEPPGVSARSCFESVLLGYLQCFLGGGITTA